MVISTQKPPRHDQGGICRNAIISSRSSRFKDSPLEDQIEALLGHLRYLCYPACDLRNIFMKINSQHPGPGTRSSLETNQDIIVYVKVYMYMFFPTCLVKDSRFNQSCLHLLFLCFLLVLLPPSSLLTSTASSRSQHTSIARLGGSKMPWTRCH